MNALELHNVTKRFGEKVIANDHVSLTVRRGEILAVLGENGSGKTTLMNMIAGIYHPDEGEIYVNGQPVTISSPRDAFRCGIGMVHQHFKLVDVFTATENIVLGVELPGRSPFRQSRNTRAQLVSPACGGRGCAPPCPLQNFSFIAAPAAASSLPPAQRPVRGRAWLPPAR